jgi:hypothetical protein
MSLKSPPPGDSDEISVVIKALREADFRLEELTSGEVDTVSDRDGRAFLLRRADRILSKRIAQPQVSDPCWPARGTVFPWNFRAICRRASAPCAPTQLR